jgi:hypothetical protein
MDQSDRLLVEGRRKPGSNRKHKRASALSSYCLHCPFCKHYAYVACGDKKLDLIVDIFHSGLYEQQYIFAVVIYMPWPLKNFMNTKKLGVKVGLAEKVVSLNKRISIPTPCFARKCSESPLVLR